MKMRFLPERYHADFEAFLRKGGWFPGRSVDYPSGPDMPSFPEAERVLREFHGLHFPEPSWRGRETGAKGVTFDRSFDDLYLEEMKKMASLTGQKVRLVAESTEGTNIYLTENGLCFGVNSVAGYVSLMRETFEDTLACMFFGLSYRGIVLATLDYPVPWYSGRFDDPRTRRPAPWGPWGLLRDSFIQPVTEADVRRKEEAMGLRYPPDYREFLLTYNGGAPVFNAFTAGPQTKVLARFCDCVTSEERLNLILEKNRERFPMPGGVSRFLVIGWFGDHDLLCYDYGAGPDNPSVVMWDHLESTPENPVIIPVASSFSGLLPLFKPFRMVRPIGGGWTERDLDELYYDENGYGDDDEDEGEGEEENDGADAGMNEETTAPGNRAGNGN